MTVFAIFTYTEFFKHKSAEGEKMNKKTTGIIAYITWIGWIVAFCAGDKEGAKFHLNQALGNSDRSDHCKRCQFYS